jgi:hypothetical protein
MFDRYGCMFANDADFMARSWAEGLPPGDANDQAVIAFATSESRSPEGAANWAESLRARGIRSVRVPKCRRGARYDSGGGFGYTES